MSDNLELKDVVGYLPYDVEAICTSNDICIGTDDYNSKYLGNKIHIGIEDVNLILEGKCAKLLLRPLSELTKQELRDNGYWHHVDYLTHELQSILNEKGVLQAILWVNNAPSGMIEFLRSRHYDVGFLIPRGLAVDKSTVNLNS